MCARWVRFFRNGGAPTYRPPNPPQGGLSCSLLPFAVRHINNHIAQPSTADMDGCRVVSSRPVPAARKARVSNKQPGPRARPCQGCSKCEDRLGWQGREGEGGRAAGRAGQGQPGAPKPVGGYPRPPKKAQTTHRSGFGVLLYCLGSRQFRWV